VVRPDPKQPKKTKKEETKKRTATPVLAPRPEKTRLWRSRQKQPGFSERSASARVRQIVRVSSFFAFFGSLGETV